jgi:DNA repair exonuclease SbcCD ATPase subunit
MRSLKFHYVRAENILCFGPKGVEIKFTDYGNVVQVRGVNLDAPGTDDNPASNGAGKSSIQELLSIALYGRTVKSPTKCKSGQIINVLADKGEVEVQWDDFRVVRTFRKSKTGTVTSKIDMWKSKDRIWDKDSYITKGTSDQTQAYIEEQLGLSHHAFCNVVIFDDSNTYSFIEVDAATKRQIVENLLDLDQYRQYHQNCKDYLKELKDKVILLTKEYQECQEAVNACARRITTLDQQQKQWKSAREVELKTLMERIKKKQSELESSNIGEQLANWQKAQDRVMFLTEEITDLESKRSKLSELIKTANEKLEAVRTSRQATSEQIQEYVCVLKEANAELEKNLKLIENLESLKEGTTCPVCHGIINRENFGEVLNHGRHVAEECRVRIESVNRSISEEKDKLDKKMEAIFKMQEKISEAEAKIAILEGKIRKNRTEIAELVKIPKPEGNVAEQVLEAEIAELKKQLKAKKEEISGDSPYKEIYEQAVAEKVEKEAERDIKAKELQDTEAEMPYLEFWKEAFGDDGIRRYVIESIIPALNARIAYWLEILIDGMIELTFDNKLDQTITRKGNPAHYYAMSNGERRRINLAVTQAFAYVMMLNSGTCPSLVFLDEITGGGIDKAGIPGVYNMIFELAKERQVFVTTHNEYLTNLLQGCETITLKKRDDITVLVS